jgi:hypothetical protein
MRQKAVRVKDRAGKQAVAIFKGHALATMQMPGQHQVVTLMTRSLPHARIVCAQNSNITIRQSC